MEEEFLISYQECEENVSTFPSSFRLVPHNVSGIPATLWLTMWPECEEFVSLNEDTYYLSMSFQEEVKSLFIYFESTIALTVL